MLFYLLTMGIYHISLFRIESISIANYVVNIAMIGIACTLLAFFISFIMAKTRCNNPFLWALFSMYLISGVTPGNTDGFLKMCVPILVCYEFFFVTLYLIGTKLL